MSSLFRHRNKENRRAVRALLRAILVPMDVAEPIARIHRNPQQKLASVKLPVRVYARPGRPSIE